MAEREESHDARYLSGEVARDVRKMEEREGVTKRDMFFCDTAEKCCKGIEINAPIKEYRTERANQPTPMCLKCDILKK